MSGAADVVAVLDASVAELRADGNTGHVESLLGARAAIAELIAADKEYDRVRNPASGCPLGEVMGAHRRRAAALANVGGAA